MRTYDWKFTLKYRKNQLATGSGHYLMFCIELQKFDTEVYVAIFKISNNFKKIERDYEC